MSPTQRAFSSKRIPWKRRPIFLWQVRIVLLILLLTITLHLPTFVKTLHPYISSTHQTIISSIPPNPCLGRPNPLKLAKTSPTIFFLHLPKTAGTLLFRLLLIYANRTQGMPCQYTGDGNRLPTHDFHQYGDQAFPEDTNERALQDALRTGDIPQKTKLFTNGICRIIRGHVTYSQHDTINTPTLSITILREPLSRFISMYEFAKSMVRSRPRQTGWDDWLTASSLAVEFANSSSLFHQAFYDETGHWRVANNVGFSFHFYGVLHQLSGIIPRFEGIGDPYHFNLANAAEMAEKAMDNLCRTHVIGLQENIPEALNSWFDAIQPWLNFTHDERLRYAQLSLNRTPGRLSRNVDDHLPERIRQELERRLEHEIGVYHFAKRIVEYRRAVADFDRMKKMKN